MNETPSHRRSAPAPLWTIVLAPGLVLGPGACDIPDRDAPRPALEVQDTTAACPTGLDYTPIATPAVQRPAASGGSYIDPTFHNKIIRVTTDGASTAGYALWGAFSVDGTDETGAAVKNFHVLDPSFTGKRYTINTVTDEVKLEGNLFPGGPGDPVCSADDAAWSHKPGEANVLYCHSTNGKALYRYSFAIDASGFHGQFQLVHDFTSDFPEVSLCQMGMDKSDSTFSFSANPGSKCSSHLSSRAVVFDRTTGSVHVYPYSALNETQMDKNGRYLYALVERGKGVPLDTDLIDFRQGTVTHVVATTANRGLGSGHQAPGSGILASEDFFDAPGWAWRAASSPESPTAFIPWLTGPGGSPNWSSVGHMSLNHADERFFVGELWSADPASARPWSREIVAVGADGTWVKRLAHHHSEPVVNGVQDYFAEPKTSTSYDARYAMFVSNFDHLGRDVYILKLPTICQ